MNEETKIVEQLVVLFPALAAWIIVALVGLIAAGGGVAFRSFFRRLREQDVAAAAFRAESTVALREIKELLASEIGKLREMHHDVDVRVARLEEHRRLDNFGRRWDDPTHNHVGGAA